MLDMTRPLTNFVHECLDWHDRFVTGTPWSSGSGNAPRSFADTPLGRKPGSVAQRLPPRPPPTTSSIVPATRGSWRGRDGEGDAFCWRSWGIGP
jgi:hypothetical protein